MLGAVNNLDAMVSNAVGRVMVICKPCVLPKKRLERCLHSFSIPATKHHDSGNLYKKAFHLELVVAESWGPWPSWWKAGQQEGSCGAGAGAERLHLNPQASGRGNELGLVWAF